jgi:hypothetical protein
MYAVGAKHERDNLWDSLQKLNSLMLRPDPQATSRQTQDAKDAKVEERLLWGERACLFLPPRL